MSLLNFYRVLPKRVVVDLLALRANPYETIICEEKISKKTFPQGLFI